MPLQYGSELEDISTDEEDLAAFLDTARAREEAAADGGPADDFGTFEGEFETDPDSGFDDESDLADRLIPDSMFNTPKGRGPSARTQKDIRAKTALFLTAGGKALKARDEYCGSIFIETIPDVSDALAAIFCESPDIVKWFTASGKFTKYLDLVMAIEPFLTAVGRHHILHQDVTKKPAEPDWTVYAAS